MANCNNRDEYFKDFIKRANFKYNNKFNYDKFIYKNAKTKSIIICPIHKEFEQSPEKHLCSKYGCPKCRGEGISRNNIGKNKRKEIASKEYFLKKANEKFGEKFEYDLSNYNGMVENEIKIKCPTHGWFEKVPHTFMVTSFGCNKCSEENFINKATKSYENFLKKANEKYGEKYIYPEDNKYIYKNRKSIINILCPIHGMFQKRTQKFLSGQECEKCTIKRLVDEGLLTGGYNETIFKNNPEISKQKGELYYLSINDGEYFKIGVTRAGVKSRIRGIKSRGKNIIYKIDIIYTKEGGLYDMYLLEQEILKKYKKYRTYTSYSTEIFNRDISKFKRFKYFN